MFLPSLKSVLADIQLRTVLGRVTRGPELIGCLCAGNGDLLDCFLASRQTEGTVSLGLKTPVLRFVNLLHGSSCAYNNQYLLPTRAGSLRDRHWERNHPWTECVGLLTGDWKEAQEFRYKEGNSQGAGAKHTCVCSLAPLLACFLIYETL